jgi:hypothetical protein
VEKTQNKPYKNRVLFSPDATVRAIIIEGSKNGYPFLNTVRVNTIESTFCRILMIDE